MDQEAKDRFSEIANLPDEEIILDEAALLVAAEIQENVDIPHYLSLMANLADKFERTQEASLGVSVNSVLDFIHVTEGFTGNAADYYDPENSYLNRVIDTKQGIPISLALIHISLGARLGVPVYGINFPRHFLVSYGSDNPVIVDPFAGRILSKPDCATLLKQIFRGKAVLQEEYFTPATNRDVLLRLLNNLKEIFWKKKSWRESKACIELQLLLLPNDAGCNVQLGAVYEMQGNVHLARHTYTEVLYASDDEYMRQTASQRLLALERKAKTLH
ncbi:MAG TPA: hypothetical protein DCM54_12835 [Gammaproteobacteria bacterium]|nr:hypothetical protein [Gammaproteobacteria bacterium]